MVLNEDPPTASTGDRSVLVGRKKWAFGVGVTVFAVALLGLGIRSAFHGSGVVPVLAIAIAVISGAAIALSLVKEQS